MYPAAASPMTELRVMEVAVAEMVPFRVSTVSDTCPEFLWIIT
jgi:hypothetical protein